MRKKVRLEKYYRRVKKAQFSKALCALTELNEGSLCLPDDVCLRIWRAIRDVEGAKDSWLQEHEGSVEAEFHPLAMRTREKKMV